ncbi:exocyst complex component EXO70C2-like [Gastrolobium bilobum]|uniref:exocyst complex component EXO70C2-like n=1 Tax=Gastrolobium bilobum TaxID=150636 RepID=UPI002AAF28C5|nr:exocyst complex component EXO70C2-like [Gastrolobium bilobum]
MEKDLAEHSGSFAGKDENTNVDDISHSPVPETADNIGAKPDSETEKAADADRVQGEPKEGEEEEEETVVAVEVPPETPLPSLEKVSEDIDRLLLTLQQNNDDNNNADVNEVSLLEIPDFVERFLDLVEEKIARYDTGATKSGEVVEEDSSLLEAVNRISKLMKLLREESQSEKEEINGKNDLLVNRIGVVQQRAMSYLEDEFRLLMEESGNHSKSDPKGKHVQAEPPESEPAETVTHFPGYTEEAVASLNKIAREMISGGYESECFHDYTISRRHALEESVHKLGFQKFTIEEIQKMQWEALERDHIPTWINTFKECAAAYFPGERKLAESVFSDHPSTAASLFSNISRGVTIQLLNFAESMSMTKRAGEKLFKLLDMYETLRDLIPNLDNLFPDDYVSELKAETTSGKCRLGEAAILIFCDLENSIKSDTGKTPVAGGAVHPLTRYIMNYLRLACEYKDTLEEVFREHSKIERADSTSRPHYEEEKKNVQKEKENASPFAAQLMRVMELLDSNLEGKAKLYKEVALSCIFMMNNGRYIVQKIKGSSEIYEVMGETWCRKRSTELRTYHKNYQIETWSKILGCLSPKGLSDNGKVQKPVLKERFKSFNALFEEIHKTQSTWVVSDEQLQSELRVSISALVIPAYRSFLGRFSQYLDPGRQTEKYIKLQAEDVENYIDELFDGNPHHQAIARKKA